MTIKIITTGGTIDDLEYGSADQNPASHESLIPELLKTAKATDLFDIEQVISKDSRFITEVDRKMILVACEKTPLEQIIISHGTYTIPLTAKFLGESVINKTIVLFGAMIPANKPNSDALFNLGTAIIAVKTLPRGVYVTMNGKIFDWKNVRKDNEQGIFVEG